MKKINSVASFVNEISKLEIKGNNYFRGHSSHFYELIPGIYRKENERYLHLENEHKMYHELISKVPSEFNNKNTLESLTLMQHYGLPTRILDVTENALIALYFACNSNFENDGEVYVFDVDDNYVVNYSSDRACILSNLSKLKSNFIYRMGLYERAVKYKQLLLKELDNPYWEDYYFNDEYEYVESFIKDFVSEKIFNKKDNQIIAYVNHEFVNKNIEIIEKAIVENFDVNPEEGEIQLYILTQLSIKIIEKINSYLDDIKEKSNREHFGKLIDFIKEDKAYFEARILPTDLKNVLLVNPKLDNNRIVRQQGAFFIFGIQESKRKKQMAKFDNGWINKKLRIECNAKKQILKELEKLGISEISIFPEIDKVAKFIRDKYRN